MEVKKKNFIFWVLLITIALGAVVLVHEPVYAIFNEFHDARRQLQQEQQDRRRTIIIVCVVVGVIGLVIWGIAAGAEAVSKQKEEEKKQAEERRRHNELMRALSMNASQMNNSPDMSAPSSQQTTHTGTPSLWICSYCHDKNSSNSRYCKGCGNEKLVRH